MRLLRIPVYLAAALALGLLAPLARGSQPRSGGPATFAGSCQLTGNVAFVPPLTSLPRPTRDYAHEAGTCSGSLTTRGHVTSLSNTPVSYFATDSGAAASCAASPEATGWGFLRFRRATIPFTLSENRAVVARLSLTGFGGGTAQGLASISSSANPAQVAQECAGPGLGSAPVDISLETTPSISG